MNKLVLLGDASNPHIQRWMGYFIKRAYEIHLISFQAGDIDGVKIHYIRTPDFLIISQITKLWRKIGFLSAIYKVRKLIFSIAPDILHAHWSTSYGLLAAVSGFHPLVISTWGSDIMDSPKKSWIIKKTWTNFNSKTIKTFDISGFYIYFSMVFFDIQSHYRRHGC